MSERLFDYLLGELAPEERAAFEADPARVADAERLRPIVTRLESLEREEWDPPEAPALVLPGAREPRTTTPRRRRRVLTLRPLVAAGLALLLLAIGVGAGRLLDEGGGNDRGRVLALDPVEPAGGSAHGTATILARGGRARFVVRGLKPSANGGFYELWLMNSADDLRVARVVPGAGLRQGRRHRPAACGPGRLRRARHLRRAGRRQPRALGELGAARTAEAELNETGPPPAACRRRPGSCAGRGATW